MSSTLYYLFKKVSRLIINIDIVFLIAIVFGLALLFLGKFHAAHVLFLIVAVCGTFIVLFPIGYYLAVFLENRFPRLDNVPIDTVGIIILGTGFDFAVSVARKTACYLPSIGRLLAFIELTKQYPTLRLVFTGGGIVKNTINESAMAKILFKTAGLNIERIEFEKDAKDTNENAKFTYEMVKPAINQKWLLVTSAIHMPRSIGLFRKLGWNVVPYPVDYHTSGKYKFFNISVLFALYMWRFSVHEFCEMFVNYVFKASDEFISSSSIKR